MVGVCKKKNEDDAKKTGSACGRCVGLLCKLFFGTALLLVGAFVFRFRAQLYYYWSTPKFKDKKIHAFNTRWAHADPEVLAKDRQYQCGEQSGGEVMDLVKDLEENLREDFDSNPAILQFAKPSFGNPEVQYGTVSMQNDFPLWICDFVGPKICHATITLQSDEAIVLNICTPHKADYFSLSLVNLVRFEGYKFAIPGAEITRGISFDSVNTTASEDELSWNQAAFVIISASPKAVERIRSEAIAVGVPERSINVLALPDPKTNFLRYRHRDQMIFTDLPDLIQPIVRLQNPESKDAGMNYYATSWSGFVFRPRVKDPKPEFYQLPITANIEHFKRTTGEEVMVKPGGRGVEPLNSLPSLSSYRERTEKALEELKDYMKTRHNLDFVGFNPGSFADFNQTRCIVDDHYNPIKEQIQNTKMGWVGTRCLRTTLDCLYASTDVNEPAHFENAKFKPGRVFVFFGVNPAKAWGDFYWNIMVTLATPQKTTVETLEQPKNLVNFGRAFLAESWEKAGLSDPDYFVAMRGVFGSCPDDEPLCKQAEIDYEDGSMHPIYRFYLHEKVGRPPIFSELDDGRAILTVVFDVAEGSEGGDKAEL